MTSLFDAVLDLVSEVGYDRMTMDAIASRAKVSKATIYRHWPGKPELVVAALRHRHVSEVPDPPDTGTLRGDLRELLLCAAPHCVADIRLMQSLAFAMHTNPELAQLVRETLLPAFRQPEEALLARAVARGEVPATADLSMFHELVPALMVSRYLIHGLPIDESYLNRVIDQVLMPVVKGMS